MGTDRNPVARHDEPRYVHQWEMVDSSLGTEIQTNYALPAANDEANVLRYVAAAPAQSIC